MQVIRCRVCKRLFSDYAERCPDCGRLSPNGRIKLLLIVGSVLLASIALAVTFLLAGLHH